MSWLKLCQSQIVVNIDKYRQQMSDYILDLQQRSQERQEQLKGTQLDAQQVLNGLTGYPDIHNLQAALQSNNLDVLEDQLLPIRQFVTSIGYGREQQQQRDAAYNSFMHLRNFLDSQDPYSYTRQDAEQQIAELLAKTQQNMQWLSDEMQNAISRIEGWNNSPIFITPVEPYDETARVNWLIPSDDALVTVGAETEDAPAPGFEVFVVEGKITIPSEGIIEDDDFFQNPNFTRDYFGLIRELQNPGSSSKPGKTLTLYTARPRKDREMYLSDSTSIPGGIWLTSSADNAANEGFEAGGLRDLWKVRIDERYVQQKLNVPAYKHYEVMGRDRVPVKSMQMLGEI